MFNYEVGIVGSVLTIISLIHGLFTSVISVTVLTILIYHQYNNRLKREEKINLVLSINIYLLMFTYATALVSVNIQTLLGDIYGNNFDSSWCMFQGYFTFVISCALYHVFVIQAFFRLCRIVYTNYRWIQLFWFYVISIPILIIIASILLCPILILHYVIYLPNVHDCFISFTNIPGIVYVVFTCYGLPLIDLSLIYIRITLFIRQQSTNLALAIQRRQKRDLVAIQRIFINVGLLLVIGLPGIIVILISFITGVEPPLSDRILWMGAEVSTAILSIEMVFMTPQLKNIVMRKWQQNRVMAIEGPIQMRTVEPVQ